MVSPVSGTRASAAHFKADSAAIERAASRNTISAAQAKGLQRNLEQQAGGDGAVNKQDHLLTRQMLRMAKTDPNFKPAAQSPAANTRRAAAAEASPALATFEELKRILDDSTQQTIDAQTDLQLPARTPLPKPASAPAFQMPTTPLFVQGGAGVDNINGGTADDTLQGGDGDDDLNGFDGNDTIRGQGGNDTLYGNRGNDTLIGGAGNDTFLDRDGDNDKMRGGAGNDIFFADSGNNKVNGGAGNDTIRLGDGNNKVNGGGGQDTIEFSGFADEYNISQLAPNKFRITHKDGGEDGTTVASNVEKLAFLAGVTINTKKLDG